MLLFELILRKLDKGIQVETVVIQDKDTAHERILQNEIIKTYKSKDWVDKIKSLYDEYNDADKKEEIEVRCVVVETDVITSTTSTIDPKNEMSLLRENISMFNHQLMYDTAYILNDTDYYIVSLVNNDLLHAITKIRKALKIKEKDIDVISQNNLVLSLINKRLAEGRSNTDYGVVIFEEDCWKVYIIASEGVPYRILEAHSSDEVCSIFYSGSISKAILLSCGDEFFNVKSIIKIHRGVLSEQQKDVLYMYDPVEVELEIDVESEDVLLLKNSIDYEGVSRWLLPKRLVAFFSICIALAVLVMASLSFFLLSDTGSQIVCDTLNQVLGSDNFKTNSERNQELLDVVNKACSLAGLSTYDISVHKEVVTVKVVSTKLDEQITYLIDILEQNHYHVVVDSNDEAGTRTIQVAYEELKLDIDTNQIIDNTADLLSGNY